MLTIHLAGPPRGKGRPRASGRNGFVRMFTDKKTQNFEAAVRLAAQQAQGSAPLLAGGVSMAIVAVFPVPASWSKKKQRAALAGEVLPTVKPDSDNLSKCKDALNGVAWKDDAQVCVEMVWKVYGLKPGTTFLVKPFAGYVADILELTKLTDSIRKGEDRS